MGNAVSYTHLDVYKRQYIGWSIKRATAVLFPSQCFPIITWFKWLGSDKI